MAITPMVFVETTLTTNPTTRLYLTPPSTTAIVTSITLANASASAADVTLSFNGVKLFAAAKLAANTTWLLGPADFRGVLVAETKIRGGASVGATVDIRICGVEVTA